MIRLRSVAVAVTLVVAVVIGSVTSGGRSASAADPVTVDVVTSAADGSAHVTPSTRTVTPSDPPAGAGTVQIDLDQAKQRYRGVGAALTESSAYVISQLPAGVRHDLLEALFAPDRGGLSVLRLPIGSSEFALALQSLDDSDTPDPELAKFSIARDRQWVIPVLHEILAIDPDIELIASPWSAPAWMKNTDNFLYGILEDEYEGVYADYLVKFLEAYRAEGIDIGWLTVQNEPASFQITMPSMLMSADQQARLVHDDLGPRLAAAGLATRVLAWDHNWCDARPPGGCVGTGTATFPGQVYGAVGAAYPFAGTAFHCYGGDQRAADDAEHAARPDLEIWQTECSGGTWQANPMGDTAGMIIDGIEHWENASILWNLALDPSGGPHTGGCDTCRGVATVDPASGTWSLNVEYDVLGTVARFAPAGSGALGTTTVNGTSFKAAGVCGPDGRPAVIVSNTGAARTVWVAFGDLTLPIDVGAHSVTAVRAPAGVECALGEWASLPGPPATSTTTTVPTTPTAPPSTSTDSSIPVTSNPPPTAPGTGAVTTSPVTTAATGGRHTSAPVARSVRARPTYTG